MAAPPYRQPLNDRQRRTAFVAIALALVGALALIDSLGGRQRSARGPATAVATHGVAAPAAGGDRPPRIVGASTGPTITSASPPAATATTTATATRTAIAAAPPLPGVPVRHHGAIPVRTVLARARTFLSVYLVYEVQPLDPVMRAALRRSATPMLAARLLAHPVRLPVRDTPAIGTVQALELGVDADSTTVTADATIDHVGWVSGLILDFDRAGGRWLVSHLS